MAQLAGQTGSASMTVAPDWSGASWAMLTASAACTACGVCARACPTGALRFDRDASLRFALNFIPRSCVGCEACVHVCFPAALTVDHAPAFQPVFGDPAVYTLAAGELGECPRCHAPMAVRPGETLCSVCAHWQLNPFGSRLPPGRSSPPSSLEQPQ
jgi:ferredoxin